jgi:hypothetical protein
MLQRGLPCGLAWLLVTGLALAQVPKADDKPIRVECHGKLRDGLVAIGGETTGTTLRFRGVTWELQFPDAAGKAFAAAHHKQSVRVTGTLRRVAGVERPARWIVDVAQYAESDSAEKKDGVAITQTGTVIRDPNSASQLFLDTGETACPIALPAGTTVRPGQKIRIQGDVEAPESPSAGLPFLVRVTKVEPATIP